MSDTAGTTQADTAQVDTVQADTMQADTTQVGAVQTEMDPVIAETLDVFKAEGVFIEVSDPEYKALDAILKDRSANINQYRKELFKQIEAKRERLSQPAKPAEIVHDNKTTARTYFERAHNPANTAKPTAQPTPPTSGRRYLEQAHSKGGK